MAHSNEAPGDRLRRLLAEWLVGYSSEHTRAAYRGDLRSWTDFCDRSALDPLSPTLRRPHIDAWARSLEAQGEAPRTRRRRMAAVCAFYSWCVAEDQVMRNPAVKVRRPPVPAHRNDTALTEAQLVALLTVADTSDHEHAPRERFALRLMASNGLRVGSLVAANTAHLGTSNGMHGLTFHAKGGRSFFAPFNAPTLHACQTYLAHRAARREGGLVLRGNAPAQAEPLFTTYDGLRRATKGSFTKALQRLATIAFGPELGEAITPHWLRHTFATLSLDQGVDLRRLQDAMGHASMDTTRGYDADRDNVLHHPTHRLTHIVSSRVEDMSPFGRL